MLESVTFAVAVEGDEVSDVNDFVVWYVRVDDATRLPGPRLISVSKWMEMQAGIREVFRAMPNGSSLRDFQEAGTVCVTVPRDQLESMAAVNAAFESIGFMRDPASPG